MRFILCCAIALLSARIATADLVLEPALDQRPAGLPFLTFYQINNFGLSIEHTPTNVTGSATLSSDESQLALTGISFTRPSDYSTVTVHGVQVEIWTDQMSWSLSDVTVPVVTNSGDTLTTSGFANTNWLYSGTGHSGTYRLTGAMGTIVNGSFSITDKYSGPFGKNWDVISRDASGNVTGLEGLVPTGFNDSTVFSGNIDGTDMSINFGSNSNPFFMSGTVAIPEPSFAPLMLGLLLIRRRLLTC